MIYTYQSRITLDNKKLEILEEYTELYNNMQHALYAEVTKGKTSASCKNHSKHVWHFWGEVKRKVKTVLAAHVQAKLRSSGLTPLRQ